ncbi:uncharacterized protein LOC142468425 [Ascaphus truei]|uniref:uncharacterized protein LOC142468425 n=2 Tax=Ascaphus truei TaxID=8439 RepID=UPI003F5AB967
MQNIKFSNDVLNEKLVKKIAKVDDHVGMMASLNLPPKIPVLFQKARNIKTWIAPSRLKTIKEYTTNGDVTSLYTSISHQQGFEAIDKTLSKDPNMTNEQANFILDKGTIKTMTHFKDVDKNNYILQTSCHHPSWLRNVPYGQCRRMKINCTDDANFKIQTKFLEERFYEKDSNKQTVQSAIQKVENLKRDDLLIDVSKNQDKKDFNFSFITNYNRQAGKIVNIVNKYWHIIKNDEIIGDMVPDKPVVIFKRAKTLKDKLAPSALPKNNLTINRWLPSIKGFFGCTTYKACVYRATDKHQFVCNVTKKKYTINKHITCRSNYIIYLIECPCGLQYVGKTKRQMNIRILEHIGIVRPSSVGNWCLYYYSFTSYLLYVFQGRTSAASKKEMWDTIVIGVNACGNSVRDKYHCRKRFDDIRSKLKKKIQHQRVHATGTGGGPTPQRLILTPLEELLRPKLLTVVVEGLAGDRDIGIYPSQFPAVAPGGHVSPEMEQVSSPGSASSTLLEEHHGDEDDEYDEDDATEETEIQSCDHEEVPIETVVPPNRPSTSTYDAIVASEGKIVDAENRRHSDMMTVLERMIGLQEETVSQLAHLHRVFIEVPKQLQKINTSFEALVVQQTQANYWRMTNVPQFNTSQPGSVHAGQFSPHSSDIHSPGPNVTGQVADIAVQVPDDILPLPSVQIQQQTPTKEATKTKQDTHETDQPSLVQCLPTCSHVSLGTSPVREQSLPKSPVGESLPKSPVGESLPKSPVGESLPKSPVGESLPKSPVGESLATSPVGESLATSPVGEQSLATSPAREVPEATQSGSVVPKVGGKRKRKIQETTSRPVTRSQKEQKK